MNGEITLTLVADVVGEVMDITTATTKKHRAVNRLWQTYSFTGLPTYPFNVGEPA
ncbi:hypothetical protein DY000_02002667 [Brassica cretica]|nr:hypothetical protein DY000_02002667 [Brassica cretica]